MNVTCPGIDQNTIINGLVVGLVRERWAPGVVQGCGSRNVSWSDYHGMYDCRDCGVYFTESEFAAFAAWADRE